MAMSIIHTISWQMVTIFHGFTLCKPYMSLKMKKGGILQKCKKMKKNIKKCFNVLQFKFTIIETHVGCDRWIQFMTS
jgi:hypothetical protein